LNARKTETVVTIMAPVLSGVLLVLAFPTHDLWWLAWIALVPLLLAILGKKPKYAFLLSWLCGIVFFVGLFDWIREVSGFRFYHHIILLPIMGAYFALVGLVLGFIGKRRGVRLTLVAAPFVWVSMEFIRSNFFFLALPWALIAQSQYKNLHVIQFASFTGAYGVSFLVVLVNAAVAAAVLAFSSSFQRWKPRGVETPKKIKGIGVCVVTAALVGFAVLHGWTQLSHPFKGNSIKMAVVQGNIEQHRKWDPGFAEAIMQTYKELTQRVSEQEPSLIIWPETATPGAIRRNWKIYKSVMQIASEADTFLLLGSSQHQKFRRSNQGRIKYFNSAFLISPEEKKLSERYDKIRLLPFAEYVPLEGRIPWTKLGVPGVGNYVPGNKFKVFETNDFRFGVTICWESLFPDLVRQFVENGAQFLVNITNEAWFGRTSAPYLFLSMNVFRAVENRVYMVRCANTGVSCFIDPNGRIVNRVKNAQDQDIFVRGVLTGTIIPMESKTVYTRYGDWFAWVCIGCSLAFLIMSFLRKNRNLIST